MRLTAWALGAARPSCARGRRRGPDALGTQFNGDVMRVNRLSDEPGHDSDGVVSMCRL